MSTEDFVTVPREYVEDAVRALDWLSEYAYSYTGINLRQCDEIVARLAAACGVQVKDDGGQESMQYLHAKRNNPLTP